MRDRPLSGASLRETGSREPDPCFTGSGPAGFDPARKRLHGDGLRVCRCGGPKHPRATQCTGCYRPRWREDEDAALREFVAAGWEYTRIARKLKRTAHACRNRAKILGVSQSREATLENRQRGRDRFRRDPVKAARRIRRMKKVFTARERAVRAEEARLNKAFSFEGRHHTPEVCDRIRAAHLGRVMSPETRAKISAARKAYWAAKHDGGQSAYRAALAADRARLQRFNPTDEETLIWCGQCERQVSAARASACGSPFCKAKELAA